MEWKIYQSNLIPPVGYSTASKSQAIELLDKLMVRLMPNVKVAYDSGYLWNDKGQMRYQDTTNSTLLANMGKLVVKDYET